MTFLLTTAPLAVLMFVCYYLGFAIPALIFVNLLWRLSSTSKLPRDLPWAGVPGNGGPWSRLRSNVKSIVHLKSLIDEGYTKYSKHDRPYVLPHILTGPEVVLPVSQARWLCEQPDNVLSQVEVNRRFLEADHTFFHPNIVREPIHPKVIKHELTHKLNNFADGIVNELQSCLEEDWGLDTEGWRVVNLYETMLDIISRLSMRVLIGKELCRNKEFLASARNFDRKVALSAAAINLLPEFLKPIIAPILTAYDYIHYLTIAKFILPRVKERLGRHHSSGDRLPLFDKTRTDNYIQWAIDHALAHWDPLERTPTLITKRFASLTFAAIQSSVITITNTLLDIASSPDPQAILETMRAEILSDISSNPSQPPWDKAVLARLRHVDSAIRESMRLNGFVARGIMKTVMAPGGITLWDGTHLPKGAKVGIQAYSVHRDEDFYPNAQTYQPFRFVSPPHSRRPDQETDTAIASGSDTESLHLSCTPSKLTVDSTASISSGRKKPLALVTTSPTFLAFSHGPNACPGRFFAANQMKLTLAHIALYYDIEPLPQRPESRWFVGSLGPPFDVMVRVRRRRA